ncbi:hypothetical protein ACJX0J_025042, partial [Zea mays]
MYAKLYFYNYFINLLIPWGENEIHTHYLLQENDVGVSHAKALKLASKSYFKNQILWTLSDVMEEVQPVLLVAFHVVLSFIPHVLTLKESLIRTLENHFFISDKVTLACSLISLENHRKRFIKELSLKNMINLMSTPFLVIFMQIFVSQY